VIDEEHLPAEYGGECACEGGCIPGGGKFVDLKDDGTTYNPAEVSIGRKGVPPSLPGWVWVWIWVCFSHENLCLGP
jgi:hypothetical protein